MNNIFRKFCKMQKEKRANPYWKEIKQHNDKNLNIVCEGTTKMVGQVQEKKNYVDMGW